MSSLRLLWRDGFESSDKNRSRRYLDSANLLAHKYETAFCVVLAILVYLCRDNPYLVYPQILYLFVVLLALNFAAGLALRLGYFGEWVSAALIMANCATITSILAYSGKQESNLWVLYLLPIYTACILLGGREVAWITLGALSFNWVHFALSDFVWGVDTYFAISVQSSIFIFAAISTWKVVVSSKSSQREFEARLEHEQERLIQTKAELILFRKLLDQSSDGIVVIDPTACRVLDVNETFCASLGYARDEVVGSSMKAVGALTPDYLSWEEFVRQIRADKAILYECAPRRKDGTTFPMEVNMQRVYRLKNDYLIAIARDITGRKRVEEEKEKLQRQLVQSQKMEATGQLAGGVAHDFNNLLTAILGYCNLLETSLEAGDPRLDDLGEIVRASNRAAALTGQLLAFSRRQVLALKVLNLNAVVESTKKMLRRLIREDIELMVALEPGLRNVKADAGRIEQVIMNLVVNARDAMPGGGAITIETKNVEFHESSPERHDIMPAGAYVMMAVSDTGCGMNPDTLSHLFEPFFTTKEQGKGTGLGLSTVYGIVKQSGGYIWVDSEVNRGTAFKIYFPTSTEAVEKSIGDKAPIKTLTGCETILLVEDDESVRHMLVRSLKRNGYNVLEACNGEEAIAMIERKGEIDLILTDIVMPKLGGRGLADYVSVVRPRVKIIFMSGYTDDVVIRQGEIKPDMMFIEKPIKADTLLRQIRYALDEPATPQPSALNRAC